VIAAMKPSTYIGRIEAMSSSSDPIGDEVRAARNAIAKEFDYDIERVARTMQEHQAKGDRPVVQVPPKRIPPSTSKRCTAHSAKVVALFLEVSPEGAEA
jgi:hypothetical protein